LPISFQTLRGAGNSATAIATNQRRRLGACPLIESKALLAELLGDFACPRLVYVDHIEGARIASLRPCAKGEAK
jgi:hypothetical protein